MADLAQTGGIVAVAVGLVEVIKMLVGRLSKQDGENGSSGQKPTSYWRMEVRAAVKEELEEYDRGRMDKLRLIIQEELRRRP